MTAQTVSNAVAQRQTGPVTIMWARGEHFKAVLPAHIDVKAFLGTAAGALYASDDLMQVAARYPDSLITALMRCAALGHQPGTDEFYLIPRKGGKNPGVQGIEGYRGIIERMYRSGAVSSVVVREVCANDSFDYVEGVHDKPEHHVDWFGTGRGRGEMIGVYAYATLTTGAVSRVVILSRADVMAARESSDAKDTSFSPWNRLDGGKDHPEFTGRSMWWKTAARRLEPWVPTSAEYRREQLRAAAAAHGAVDPQDGSAPVPVTARQSADLAEAGISTDIHDAEIVDEGTDARPRTPEVPTAAGPADGTEPTTGPAPAQTAQPASRQARERLTAVTGRLALEDTGVLFGWLCGEPFTGTRTQVQQATTFLDDHLTAANGDIAVAGGAIWLQYERAQQHP